LKEDYFYPNAIFTVKNLTIKYDRSGALMRKSCDEPYLKLLKFTNLEYLSILTVPKIFRGEFSGIRILHLEFGTGHPNAQIKQIQLGPGTTTKLFIEQPGHKKPAALLPTATKATLKQQSIATKATPKQQPIAKNTTPKQQPIATKSKPSPQITKVFKTQERLNEANKLKILMRVYQRIYQVLFDGYGELLVELDSDLTELMKEIMICISVLSQQKLYLQITIADYHGIDDPRFGRRNLGDLIFDYVQIIEKIPWVSATVIRVLCNYLKNPTIISTHSETHIQKFKLFKETLLDIFGEAIFLGATKAWNLDALMREMDKIQFEFKF